MGSRRLGTRSGTGRWARAMDDQARYGVSPFAHTAPVVTHSIGRDHFSMRCYMRYFNVVVTGLLVASSVASAQDVSREVADGGIKVAGWQGKIDPGEAKRGAKLEGAKIEMAGKDLHVTTGPAVAYWLPSNVANG